MQPYCHPHCGFWQRRFDVPPVCPMCEDYRHPLPPDGYFFYRADEVSAQVETVWEEVLPGILQFRNEPQVGIGPCGYLILRPEGNVAFEGASWYDAAALDHIERLGGIRYLSASHAHVFGALWQLVERFDPEVVLHAEHLPWAQAFKVSWPFDDRATLLPGVTLHHTGGHTPGHTVLHLEDRQILFCGDALKFELDEGGQATTISCHKAFDAHIPLTHDDVRHYRRVLEPLAFDAVVTPWEVVPGGGKRAALRLFEAQLAGRPFADRFSIHRASDEAALASSEPRPVALYRRALPAGETFEFPITALDKTGVPVWTVAYWHEDGDLGTAVGYGATEAQARTGAWGELTEKVMAHAALNRLPRLEKSYRALKREGMPALDPLRLRLPVTTDYTPDRPLQWVEARRYPSEEPIWIPVEEAAAYFADLGGDDPDRWLYTPITNGLGAGDTRARALMHGFLELVQRDGNSASYRALDRGLAVDLDSLADPALVRLLDHYDALGLDILVKLAATDFGMTNLYVVGAERDPAAAPHPIMLSGCGEGVHPDREVALAKALREYAASRVRKRFNHGPLEPMAGHFPAGYLERVRAQPAPNEEGRSFREMRAWMHLDAEDVVARLRDNVFRVDGRVRFSELPTVAPGTLGDPAEILGRVAERFADEGLELFYLDYTPEGSDVHAVKALVPELEVETMTYHRIGPRNLRRLLNRGSDLVGLGKPPSGAYRIPLTEAEEERLGGPAWFSLDAAEAAVGDLYAMYREPKRHVLALST